MHCWQLMGDYQTLYISIANHGGYDIVTKIFLRDTWATLKTNALVSDKRRKTSSPPLFSASWPLLTLDSYRNLPTSSPVCCLGRRPPNSTTGKRQSSDRRRTRSKWARSGVKGNGWDTEFGISGVKEEFFFASLLSFFFSSPFVGKGGLVLSLRDF